MDMEMLTVLPLISLAVAVALIMVVIRVGMMMIKNNTAAPEHGDLPPGPSKLPLIGSMHHLATGELPHHALARLAREHGPAVMHLQMGQVGLVVISCRDAAREVMKAQDANFAHRPELTGPKALLYGCADVAFASGPRWRRLRKMCVAKLLCASRVKSLAPIRREETRALLETVARHCLANDPGGPPIALRAMLEALTSAVVSRTVLGETFQHRGAILKEGLQLTSGFSLSDHFPSLGFLDVPMRLRLRRVSRQVDKLLEDIIGERKRLRLQENVKKRDAATEDMLDVLLDAMEQPADVDIGQDNIKAVIMDMFVGGTETSSTTIEWAMAELMKNPKEMARAQEEVRTRMKGEANQLLGENVVGQLSYLRLIVKETLRLHMPAPLLVPRVCKQRCRLGGYAIPAGCRVVVNAWALGRDPRYWEDAEAFRPGRFLGTSVDYKGCSFEFLPFGAGRRICPGIEFGLAGIELCLAQLLFYFDWKLPGGMAPEDLDMSEASVGVSVVRKMPLRLIPSIHAPLDLKFERSGQLPLSFKKTTTQQGRI